MSQFDDLAVMVKEVLKTEHEFLLHGPRHDPVTTPWMPYQPADFIGILWECLSELPTGWEFGRPFFYDVGCGPGTKLRIAQELFGFRVGGIEIDKKMAGIARQHFGDYQVTCGDALNPPAPINWSPPDVIWLYRPFRDPVSETRLEQSIISGMKPGAILAGSSWEIDPGALGWAPVVDDCLISPDGKSQIVRGAWKKPRG